MESLIGTTLGGYKLIRAIGSGGMGTVYLAEDASVGQQVAIKIVRTDDDVFADISRTEKAVERFRQEARTIAALDHLHILPLYRYGEEKILYSVQSYMVMQYRPEGSLWDWLRRRAGQTQDEQGQISHADGDVPLPAGLPTNWPLGVIEVADYLQQASSALQYAHDHGIVHRDVKPANFLLRFDSNHATNTTHAFLLLSDFGLAKFFTSSSAISHVLGTPMYMAPEQFYSNAGPESDQYALAIMIYYMLAGRPPFTGEPAKMMHQHLNVIPPPIRTFVPDLSYGIEAVLKRALAKQIQERYPRIEDFAEDFLRHVNHTTPTAQTHLAPSGPLILASGYIPVAAATPAEMSPLLSRPQITPYPGGQSPIPATFDPRATASPPVSLPPPLLISAAGNSIPPAQRAYPGTQSWHQDATIQQIEEVLPPPTYTPRNKASRRRVVGWIIGGIVALGTGVGAGIYLYGNEQPVNTYPQSQNPPNTPPVQQPAAQEVTARYILTGHSNEVRSISWSPTGTTLASGSLDRSVHIWDIAMQQTVVTYASHTQGVVAVAWGRDEQAELVASGGRDNSVRVWNSTTGEDEIKGRNLGSEVSTLAWTVNDATILVGTLGAGLLEIMVNKRPTAQLSPKSVIDTIALSPDGRYLATGFRGGIVTISLLLGRGTIYTIRRTNSISGLAWSPQSNFLAIGGNDQRVDIVDIATGNVVNSNTTRSNVNDLSWEPGNTGRLAIAQADGTISVWNTTRDNTLISGMGHTGAVTTVAWGDRYLASASADKTIIIWNVPNAPV